MLIRILFSFKRVIVDIFTFSNYFFFFIRKHFAILETLSAFFFLLINRVKIYNITSIDYKIDHNILLFCRLIFCYINKIFFWTGNPKTGSEEEKTIMLVGATGSGKSTLVDGIINYVMGVSFDDPFRFTLVQLEEEEKKLDNQVFSF